MGSLPVSIPRVTGQEQKQSSSNILDRCIQKPKMRHESTNGDFLQAVEIGDGDFVVIMMAKAKHEIAPLLTPN